MSIPPFSSLPPAPAAGRADAAPLPAAGDVPERPRDQRAEEIAALAAQARVEVRLLELPDSDVVLFRMVEPETGRVMREFPSEELSELLAELRRQAAVHLDRRA